MLLLRKTEELHKAGKPAICKMLLIR